MSNSNDENAGCPGSRIADAMGHCYACKLIKAGAAFSQHERYCDDCMGEAIANQPETLHFLDRLALATDELDARGRMPVPTVDPDRVLAADARRRASRQRTDYLRNPYRDRYARMYGKLTGLPPV